MKIFFSSDRYRFYGGHAALLSDKWAKALYNFDRNVLLMGTCTDNRIDGVMAEVPGEYELFLCDGVVEVRSQNVQRRFVTLEPWKIRITSEDLRRDQYLVRVPDVELFVLFFSREGKVIPNGRVTVYLEMRSVEITTDEAGTVAVLGDPGSYILSVEDGWRLDSRPI